MTRGRWMLYSLAYVEAAYVSSVYTYHYNYMSVRFITYCLCTVLSSAAYPASYRQSEIPARRPVVLSKLQRDDQQPLGEYGLGCRKRGTDLTL